MLLGAILENLHMANPGNLPECGILLDPSVHDSAQFPRAHSRNTQIVPRRKTHHAADSALGLSDKQAGPVELERRNIGQHRGVIVLKNVCLSVRRRLCAASAPISRAQTTIGIESDGSRRMNFLDSSQPG